MESINTGSFPLYYFIRFLEIINFIIIKKLKIYFKLLKGLLFTFRHIISSKGRTLKGHKDTSEYFFRQGKSTLQYPHEKMQVPETGRYQLEVMMDDCIVCDLCAKICPVDCIEIEPIRAVGDIGKTSDGTIKKIHAAKFEIDMAKCMYCGLCTTVCPTECIIMTDTYDKSSNNLGDLIYTFADMSVQEKTEKQKIWDQFQIEKEAAKKAAKENQ